MFSKLVDRKGCIFVGTCNGTTISISIPAETEYDWGRKERFLDLPLMDKEYLENFISVLSEMVDLFNTQSQSITTPPAS